jgi:hypothetical protein
LPCTRRKLRISASIKLTLFRLNRYYRDQSPPSSTGVGGGVGRNSSSASSTSAAGSGDRSSNIQATSLFAEMIKKNHLRQKIQDRRAAQRGDINQSAAEGGENQLELFIFFLLFPLSFLYYGSA